MTAPLRIVFMGSPEFSIPSLEALIAAGHEIVCVYAQPPRPAGRGHQERRCPVHEAAVTMGLNVRTPEQFRDPSVIADFAALEADVAVVIAYGLILPQAALDVPRLGCINIHASLLPRWRGAAPIQRAIEAGDQKTGIAIMQMEAGLDTGPVFLRREVDIEPHTTGGELHDTLSREGAQAIVAALPQIAGGVLVAEAQPADGVTYAAKIGPRDGDIMWDMTAEAIARRVRAFNPWPACAFTLDDQRIKVFDAVAIDLDRARHDVGLPGTILDNKVDGCPVVACGSGALVLRELQRPGKGRQPADAFVRGFDLKSGSILS